MATSSKKVEGLMQVCPFLWRCQEPDIQTARPVVSGSGAFGQLPSAELPTLAGAAPVAVLSVPLLGRAAGLSSSAAVCLEEEGRSEACCSEPLLPSTGSAFTSTWGDDITAGLAVVVGASDGVSAAAAEGSACIHVQEYVNLSEG